LELLVSVRSADEVAPAIAGGAQIIDAKEPSRGSLGPVDPQTLSRIFPCVPENYPVSVALGDFQRAEDLEAALHRLEVPGRESAMYLKLGFAGLTSLEQIRLLLEIAVSATRAMAAPWQVVAVAYADSERAGTVLPMMIPELAKAAGAAAVLVDTCEKDGRGLLSWLAPETLALWVAEARDRGLLTALAGSLCEDELAQVCQTGPHVIGTRGAVCVGGREGTVVRERVQRFRSALEIGSIGGSSEKRHQLGSRNA
jgi:uncharacterized protein (UPF0264 family)